MPRLPVLSGKEAVEVFLKAGWRYTRTEGSHIVLTRSGYLFSLSVPNHRELKRGTLRGLIRKAGLSIEEFCNFMKDR